MRPMRWLRKRLLHLVRRWPLHLATIVVMALASAAFTLAAAAGVNLVAPQHQSYTVSLLSVLEANYAPWPESNPRQNELDPAVIEAAARDAVLRNVTPSPGAVVLVPLELPPLPQAAAPSGGDQVALLASATVNPTASSSPAPASSDTAMPVASATSSRTATQLPSSTPSRQPSASSTAAPSVLPATAAPSASRVASATALPATALPPTATTLLPTASASATAPPTDTATATPTASLTPRPTFTATAVPSLQPTPMPSNTATVLPSVTPTVILPTPTATNGQPPFSPTPTQSMRATETPAPIATSTVAPTHTPTALPTIPPLPSNTPTAVPTDTPTVVPTDTPTALPTDTPTPTPTDTPVAVVNLYVEIINPADGATIVDRTQTAFQAMAYDPDVGKTDGQGILRVEFKLMQVSGGSYVTTRTDNTAGYCLFGGNGPCNDANTADWNAMGPGTYEFSATAFSATKPSVTVTVTFTKP